jgi:hypothetical protein
MIRRFEYHARYCELSWVKNSKTKKPLVRTKAAYDILTMVEELTKDYLDKVGASTKLSSLETLYTFKLAAEKDEPAFAFDVKDSYLRCLKLLQKIQAYALAVAPNDYHKTTFGKGLGMNDIVNELMHDLGGQPRHHASVFPVAIAVLRKLIKEEGDAVCTKAKVSQKKMKRRQTESMDDAEPSFENPPEDTMPLDMRNMFAGIVFQDSDGSCRMPFPFGRR